MIDADAFVRSDAGRENIVIKCNNDLTDASKFDGEESLS